MSDIFFFCRLQNKKIDKQLEGSKDGDRYKSPEEALSKVVEYKQKIN